MSLRQKDPVGKSGKEQQKIVLLQHRAKKEHNNNKFLLQHRASKEHNTTIFILQQTEVQFLCVCVLFAELPK